MTEPVNAELELLRAFYAAWVHLHTIPRDNLHRKQQEHAAQDLVDAAHPLRIFYAAGHEEANRPKLEVVRG